MDEVRLSVMSESDEGVEDFNKHRLSKSNEGVRKITILEANKHARIEEHFRGKHATRIEEHIRGKHATRIEEHITGKYATRIEEHITGSHEDCCKHRSSKSDEEVVSFAQKGGVEDFHEHRLSKSNEGVVSFEQKGGVGDFPEHRSSKSNEGVVSFDQKGGVEDFDEHRSSKSIEGVVSFDQKGGVEDFDEHRSSKSIEAVVSFDHKGGVEDFDEHRSSKSNEGVRKITTLGENKHARIEEHFRGKHATRIEEHITGSHEDCDKHRSSKSDEEVVSFAQKEGVEDFHEHRLSKSNEGVVSFEQKGGVEDFPEHRSSKSNEGVVSFDQKGGVEDFDEHRSSKSNEGVVSFDQKGGVEDFDEHRSSKSNEGVVSFDQKGGVEDFDEHRSSKSNEGAISFDQKGGVEDFNEHRSSKSNEGVVSFDQKGGVEDFDEHRSSKSIEGVRKITTLEENKHARIEKQFRGKHATRIEEHIRGSHEDCYEHRSSKSNEGMIRSSLPRRRNYWKVRPGSSRGQIWLAWSMKNRVKQLERDISDIKALLPDAEEKEFNDTKISNWLKRNQQFMIDADRVLDEFECQQLRRQVQNMYGRRKVRWLFLRSNPIAFRLSMAHKVRRLSQSLEKIAKEKDELHLVRREEMGMRKQRRSFADVVKVSDDDVVGRDSDKKKIIDLLLGENEDTPNVHVVSIVGVGGMGKTTLARLVYNDERVKNHFELKMWVCNSDNVFNVGRLLKEILDSATGTKNDGFTYDQLHTHLRGLLRNKRFLLVLDEMQNEDRMEWSELNKFLVVGSKGSRILVTTRSQKVAEIMRSNKSIHTLQPLSEGPCETLILRYSFDQGKLEERKWDIGKEMVERCKGIPLAAKILVSLLFSKREDSEWERIKDHPLWSRNQNNENVILPVLQLGYNDLPAHLKPCFVYSSVFPKGCRFSFKEVLDVWMARGLLRSADDEDKSVEQVCKEYLEQLIFRSLIEQEEEYTYYMHDLIHDFALQLPRNKCSVITSPTPALDGHTAISCEGEAVVLRKDSEESVRNVLFKKNVSEFRYLRMLDLCGSSIQMLPSCIGKLRHLRSLNLCANQSLKRLPNSIWKLQSLEILRLDGCKELEGLPKDIRKMIRLKILTITTRATYLPDKGIECLMSLQSLEIRDCKSLTSLPSGMFKSLTALERLEIHDCPRLDISQQNAENHLNNLRHLTIDGLRKMMTLPHFLEGSRGTLCHLKISRCPINKLPEWMTDMKSVESISIQFCPNLNSLPEGMTSLISSQKLKIKGCPGLLIFAIL